MDEGESNTWIALAAATRNVVTLLRLRTAGMPSSNGTAPADRSIQASPAGALTSGEAADGDRIVAAVPASSARGVAAETATFTSEELDPDVTETETLHPLNISTVCGAHNSASAPKLKAASAPQRRQRG